MSKSFYCSICKQSFTKKEWEKHDCPELTSETIDDYLEKLLEIIQMHKQEQELS
jgi:hypothetical protein